MRFSVLGPIEIRDGRGRRCAIVPGKQQVLLAVLLIRANECVPMSTLANALWNEDVPASARKNLQTYVWRIRRALGDMSSRRLQTRPRGYLLRVGAGELDLGTFDELADTGRRRAAAGDLPGASEALTGALELWRGGPFADSDLAGGELLPELVQLEEKRLAALEDRIDVDLALDRQDTVVPELRKLVALYPLRERMHALLMVALYRCGRQCEALHAYRNARQTIRDEFGVEPGRELRALQHAILVADTRLDHGDDWKTLRAVN